MSPEEISERMENEARIKEAQEKRERDKETALEALHRIERYLKSARFVDVPIDGLFRNPHHIADVTLAVIYRSHGGADGFYPKPEKHE